MDNLYSPAATDDFFSNGFHQFYNELQDDPDGFNCWATASPQYNDFYFTSSAAYHDLDSGYSDLKSSSDNSNYCSADEFSLNCAASERINCDVASIQYNDLSDLSDINYKELYNLEHNFEINLENFLLDNNCDNINSAPPDSHPSPAATSTLWQQTFQQLPAKTPLCNNLCENFLREDDTSANAADDQHKSPLEEYPDKPDNGTCGYSLDEKKRKFPEEKQFICNYETCRKVYAKPAHLKAHLRRHVGDKPYICNWTNCTWRFSRSDELARHRRSHSGIKPYKCDYCVKCFSRSDHLSKHRRVHERKMAANKLKNIWVSLPKGRPGRKPKSSRGANNS